MIKILSRSNAIQAGMSTTTGPKSSLFVLERVSMRIDLQMCDGREEMGWPFVAKDDELVIQPSA
jgi:hypothetical protein